MKAIVTGGTGFIGGHVVDALVENDYEVTILSSCLNNKRFLGKSWLNKKANLVKCDITSLKSLEDSLKDADILVHQAGLTGYATDLEYLNINAIGTVNIFQAIENKNIKIKKLIYSSTNAVYGQGKFNCEDHGFQYPNNRTLKQLKEKKWELNCPVCNKEVKPIAIDETSPTNPSNVYALTKRIGELQFINSGQTLGIPHVILRTPLVYGPREYKKLIQTFSKRIYEGQEIKLNEDGNQLRDLIYVKDVADANVFAAEKDISGIFNLSSGNQISLLELVNEVGTVFGSQQPKVTITSDYREGDIRHVRMDDAKIRLVGFTKRTTIKDGLELFRLWMEKEFGSIGEYFSRTSVL